MQGGVGCQNGALPLHFVCVVLLFLHINTPFLSDLFAALEKENNTLEPCCAPQIGIESYGVSMTTLEEVFLKLSYM